MEKLLAILSIVLSKLGNSRIRSASRNNTKSANPIQACRAKFGSKWHMWEKLRSYIDLLVFETWEALLNFSLNPSDYVQWAKPPPSG